MKKSILSVFVTLAMLLSFMPAALADSSNATYELVPDSYTVAQGDNITFSFNVKNAELISSVAAKLSYDPEKLVLVSCEKGNIYNYDYTSTGSLLYKREDSHRIGAMLAFESDHDISSDTIFKATFMVATNLEPGDYSDYITVEEATAFRGTASFNLKGSVPEITVEQGDNAQPLAVTADKTTVKMGEDVTYTISTPAEIELNAFQLLLDYDKSMLEFKEGTMLEGTTSEISEDGIVWTNSEAVKADGTIATLTFTAIKNGTASVTAAAESAPTAVKANFPDVIILSDVAVTVTADRNYAAAGDVITYTASLDSDVAVKGLQLSLDFSKINTEAESAELGASLAGIDAIANEVAFKNGMATVAFANAELTEIPAGEIAKFSFKLSSDLTGAYKPVVDDCSVTYGTDNDFTADVTVNAISPTPVTAYMSAVPDVTYVQAGDTVTYTVSIDRKIYPVAFEAHMNIDPQFVDGAITVTSLNANIEATYNEQTKDITAVAFDNNNQVEVSGDLFTVSFKTKADTNTVVTPKFTDIVVKGASVSASAASITIFAEGSATVDITSSSNFALPGGTVTYKFDLKDAKALKILNIDIGFDPAKYVDATVKVGDVTPFTAETKIDKEGGTINVVMYGASALSGTKSGIVTVEFKVADAPEAGEDGVSIDVSSDEFTKLTVNNKAKTKIVTSYGHLVVYTDKAYVFNSPEAETVEVTVVAEGVTDLSNISFVLNYDKSKFVMISPIEKNDGAEVNKPEEGRVNYVLQNADIDGDAVLMKFTLYPIVNASGYSDIVATEVATTDAVDTVKAKKSIYLYSTTERDQILTVRQAIKDIGEITADNYKDKKAKVEMARALYDNLADVLKPKLADDLKVLEAAEKAIEDFTKNFAITLAKTADGYTATVVNQKSTEDDPVVVLAVYEDGVLVSSKAIHASKANVSYTGDTANTTAEVYVWNSFDDMVPYTNVEIVK